MLISNNNISFAEILSLDQNPTPPPPPSSDAIEEVWGNLPAGNFRHLASYGLEIRYHLHEPKYNISFAVPNNEDLAFLHFSALASYEAADQNL